MKKLQIAFYKGIRPGLPGIYNRLVRWWTKSPYSHCEIVFCNELSASSSFMDNGVRIKQIVYDKKNWDFVEIPMKFEAQSRQWFVDHMDCGYDLFGNFQFVLSPVKDSKNKWSCAEAIAASIGLPEPFRYSPAILFSVAKAL